MLNPNSRILDKNRLRPQKKGRLPHFTQDFQGYADRISQVIKNQVQFSFQLNKFGIEKRRRISNLNHVLIERQKNAQQKREQSRIKGPFETQICGKHLRYNQTRISPDHKIKIRNKSSKNLKKQNSQPAISQMREINLTQTSELSTLPKINLTSRQMVNKNYHLLNKENNLYENMTTRVYLHELKPKDKYYTKLRHIVTMGRKQVQNQ